MVATLPDISREVQLLSLQYERVIHECEVLLSPHSVVKESSAPPPAPPPIPDLPPNSLVCTEIDKVLEKARQLSLSGPAPKKTSSCKPHPSPSKDSMKKAKSVYGSNQHGIKMAATQDRQRKPKQLVETYTPTSVEATPTTNIDIIMKSISRRSVPMKYRKLKKTVSELIEELTRHSTSINDRPPNIYMNDEDRIGLSLLRKEHELIHEELKTLTDKTNIVTDHSSIEEVIGTKAKLELLLDVINTVGMEDRLPWRSHNETVTVSMDDYIKRISLETRLVFINMCIDALLPWLRRMNPSHRMYPKLYQVIQTLLGCNKTMFVHVHTCS